MAINPALNPNVGYDPLKDFAPVTALTSVPTILSANPIVPAHTRLTNSSQPPESSQAR